MVGGSIPSGRTVLKKIARVAELVYAHDLRSCPARDVGSMPTSGTKIMDTNFFIEILTLYQMPALFVGSFLFGETVILAAAVLSAQGLWSSWTIFWLSLLGTLASDALWFLYGQKILSFFHKWEKYRRNSEKFLRALEKLTGARPYLSLLWVKAVYGVRIFTIIYLSVRKVAFWKFMALDAIGSAWWLGVIIIFGRLAGTGLDEILPAIGNLEYAAAAIVFIIIVWRIIFTWVSKRALREIEEEQEKP